MPFIKIYKYGYGNERVAVRCEWWCRWSAGQQEQGGGMNGVTPVCKVGLQQQLFSQLICQLLSLLIS